MYGIAGLTGGADRDTLARMSAAMRHRGPDGDGLYLDGEAGVGLAARRLAIVDVPGGQQPCSDPSGRYHLVFNGEIRNAGELRAALQADGWAPRSTHSGTESVWAMYQAHGPGMLDRLNGMFALVIYDWVKGELFGARDRFRIKPLYYHCSGLGFAFASELKAQRQHPGFERTLDPDALWHYSGLHFIPQPRSIYASVRKPPPACWFRFQLASGRLTLGRYWSNRDGARHGRGCEGGAHGPRR